MQPRDRLARTLLDESWAYGYTLTIWGAGAFLIAEYGVPSHLDVLGYIAGSLLGFAGLTWYSFGGLLVGVDREGRNVRSAVEMVHLFATFCNLLLALAVIRVEHLFAVVEPIGFFAVGVVATVGYSLLLLVEEVVGERYRDGESADGAGETDE